jgi:type IV pilus assembly protein PilA
MIQRLRNRIARSEAEGGFTLIELLVVIIIIGILLAVAVPSYLGFRTRANESASKANARAIIPSFEAYYSDNGAYNTAAPALTIAHLKAQYDAGIDTTKYTLGALTASTYCVNSTVNGVTFHVNGPGGQPTSGGC